VRAMRTFILSAEKTEACLICLDDFPRTHLHKVSGLQV
jgi:hypothetical protein